MDVEEIMIDFLLNKANDEQIEQFFGYAPHGFSREDIEDVFDELVKNLDFPQTELNCKYKRSC